MASIKINMAEKVLCRSCTYGMVMEKAGGDPYVFCNNIHRFVPPNLAACSDYHHKDQPTKWELEKIAWQVRTDRSGKVIGFERGKPKED